MTSDFPERDSGAAETPTSGGDTGERLAHDLDAAKETAKRDIDALTSEARSNVDDLKEAVGEQMHAAGDKARSFASDQKNYAADQLDGISAAVSRVADELNSGEQAAVGRYAKDIAQGVDRLAKTVRENDVDDLLGMAQSFGRSQPLAFLGAAAAVGFMASRFALASGHRRTGQQQQQQPYSPTTNTASGTVAEAPTYGGSNVH